MIVALCGIVLASAVMIALVESSSGSQKATSQFLDDQGVYYAAQGATDLALSEVWGAYKARQANQPSLDFNAYLNSRFTWQSMSPGDDPLADQFRQSGGDVRRAAVSDWSSLKLGTRIVSKFYIYQRIRNTVYPNSTTIQQYNNDLMIAAESQKDMGYDSPQDQVAAFATTGATANAESTAASPNWVAQYMTVSNPPAYKGLDFGVLTKNVQCTLCHLRVSSVGKAFNKDPSKYNSFPKVKVGSTSFMAINSGADTYIDGTLYQRGRLEDDASAKLISASNAASRVRSVVLNANGTIQQDSSGNTTPVVDTNTHSSNGVPDINGNFYANYPTDTASQTDGVLPNDDFPSAFPDIPKAADGNRSNQKIDPDEVAASLQDAVAVSDPTQPGTVKGGVAVTLAPGTQYTQTVLPNAGSAASITQSFTGNVILTGTADNPIQLDGKIVIDGDLVIRGYVQGMGQIFTTGNIYVPGDIIYKDRTDTLNVNGNTVLQEAFGYDSNSKPNLLGLVAGKNIVVGDYLSQVTNWNEGNTSSVATANPDFFAPRYMTDNGVVSMQGQADPGKILTYANDKYLNPSQVTVMPGTVQPGDGKTYSTYSQPNYTMFQLANFNQLEYTKTLKSLPDYGPTNTYDPTDPSKYRVPNTPANNPNDPYDDGYIPRFYSFYSYNAAAPKTNPVYVATTGWQQSPQVGGNGGGWNVAEQRFDLMRHSSDPVNFTDLSDIPASVQSNASLNNKTVLNIHPDWISPDTMMKIISSEEVTRQEGSRRIDGLLYTSNAVLATERKLVQVYDPTSNTWSNALSRGNGNLTINGAVVAPDMGVMTPNGTFNVNYDQRVASLLKVQSSPTNSASGPNPANWDMTKKGFTKNNGSMPAPAVQTILTATPAP